MRKTARTAVEPPVPAGPRVPGAGRSARRRSGPPKPSGLPWILPAFVLVVGLLYYCIGYTGYISTLDWDGTSPDPRHLGLDNYIRLYHDPVFWLAVKHTAIFLSVTFVIQTALGLGFAVLLHSRVRLATLYKVVIFIPVVLAPAAMAPVFRQIFAYDGQLNSVLRHIGLGSLAQSWLAQDSTAMAVIMFITIWQWTGLTFVLYFAALGQIEPEVLEAARIDGAGNLRLLASIIWPAVRGTTMSLAVLSVIGALKTFDIPYLVTGGGPNYATEFLGTYIYREGIPQAEVGYAAALSIMLLLLALITSIGISLRRSKIGRGNV